MKAMKKNILLFRAACTVLIGGLTVCAMLFVFAKKSEPLYSQVVINGLPGGKRFLYPQDTLRQTFEIRTDNLQSVAIAFDYDDAVIETGTLLVRFYSGDLLIVEQPLSFLGCPQKTFIEFGLNWPGGDALTVEVINTSENADCVLSILDTSDFYAYRDYSEGYQINGGAITESSIRCCFRYRNGHDYYKGLTCAFQVFLAVIIILRLLEKGFAWLQPRICH